MMESAGGIASVIGILLALAGIIDARNKE